MKDAKPVEIICFTCGKDTLLIRKPKYDGFTKVGEELTCSSCGHEYEDESVIPFKGQKKIQVFSDKDRSRQVKIFREGEAARLCRHCVNYVINPFMQWCSLRKKEVEATDTCNRFEPKPVKEETEEAPEKPPKPLL